MNKVVQTWEIADVGPVDVAVSDRARRVRITVDRTGSVKLILPRDVSLKQGREFLASSADWIRKHLRVVDLEQADPHFDRAHAKRVLLDRLEQLARVHNFSYNRAFVKNQKTRWGSCSARNNINLNVNLVRLPDELRDYVILHELVHTRHKNHSQAFWRELNRIVGHGKALQRLLRGYHPHLQTPARAQ